MLIIKSISYKNFLSVGNHPIKIDFTAQKSLLIRGPNGSGKSTSMSALSFCLFGKDFRGIKKGNLINTINRKNTSVECELSVNGINYRIVRGIKPDVFEIYKDGNILDQDSKKVDQQKFLEEKILRFTYNSFKQIVLVGGGQYVQFMNLSASERRQFIENFLEIDVFTKMKDLSRSSMNDLDKKISEAQTLQRIIDAKIEAINIERDEYSSIIANEEETMGQRIHDTKILLSDVENELSQLNEKILVVKEKISGFEQIEKKIDRLSYLYETRKADQSNLSTKIKEYDHIENCPTCRQKITDEHKAEILFDIKKSFEENKAEIDDIQMKMKTFEDVLEKKDRFVKQLDDFLSEKETLIDKKSKMVTIINESNEKILKINQSKIYDNGRLVELNDNKQKTMKTLKDLMKKKDLQTHLASLLKDDAVKGLIIRKYIKILNELINGFLQKFNFYVDFKFDENFNETIRSRFRDQFTYENFSEGEKMRIDFSILFAFRSLASMKNSLDCNILFFDEVMDSALDSNGIEDLKMIFQIFDRNNIIMISHREKAQDMFENVLSFKKVKNFTTLDEENI